MNIIDEMKRQVTAKRLELGKLEAALRILDPGAAMLKPRAAVGVSAKDAAEATLARHRKELPRSKSKQLRYRRKRVVMAAGHYEAIIGAMLFADSGKEFSAKDVVKYARGRGSHATKGAVHAVAAKMVTDGWLERCGKRVREILYRRATMDPAKWSTLYKEEGGDKK